MKPKKLFAIILCIVVAIIATFLAGFQKLIGGPMIGLILGMLIVNFGPAIGSDFKAGTTFAGKKFLNLGIILTGATLNFNSILGLGTKALPILLFNIVVAFIVAFTVGKSLKVTENTSVLVASGTTICGGSAIAAMSSVIKATEVEIAYAMAAIFLFDVVAALSYPYLATGLNLTNNQFGFLAGASINDTSSVTAAEATYSTLLGIDSNIAITVKLARTLLLVLLVVVGTIVTTKKQAQADASNGVDTKSTGAHIVKTVIDKFPRFIIWFVLMAILNTFGVFDGISGLTGTFKTVSKFFITTALVGVGFKVKFKELFTEGRKPVILGGCTWLAVFLSSFLFITIFSNYVG